MFRKRRSALFPALMGLFALSACQDSTGTETSRLSLLLTDAPGDLTEATVEIEQIYLQGGGGESPADRIVLYSGGESFDLLTLSGGKTAELASDVEVPPGTYSQLRMVVGEASIKTLDGRVYSTTDGTLQTPSFSTSGLKIKLPGGSVRVDGASTILLVDFDVSQSFGRQAGASGRWVMNPVVTATEFGLTGRIEGTVALSDAVTLPACGGAATSLTQFVPRASSGELTFSGATAADGGFSIANVVPGDYTLDYAQSVAFDNGDTLSFTAAATPLTATVGSGAITNAAYLVTAASCEAVAG